MVKGMLNTVQLPLHTHHFSAMIQNEKSASEMTDCEPELRFITTACTASPFELASCFGHPVAAL